MSKMAAGDILKRMGVRAGAVNHLFNPTFAEQYELALQQGNARFGSECKHTEVKDALTVSGGCSNERN